MRKLSGFTLVEMLIVIAIIGILAAALIPRMSSSKNKAINVATEKSIRDVTNALFLYYSDKGSYPMATTCNGTDFSNCGLTSVQSQLSQYLSNFPTPSYTQPAWSFGSGYQVPANQFGYVGLGSRYILTYYFVDTRDGKKYRVVNMPDNQRWMAENLNYKTSTSTCSSSIEANCENGYGRGYSRDEAKTICPGGWHLSSNDERGNMLNKVEGFYGGVQNHIGPPNNDRNIVYGSVAVSHLKAIQVQGGVDDSFGFSLLLAAQGGSRDVYANHWTPQMSGAGEGGVTRLFYALNSKSYIRSYVVGSTLSVRCVKD